MSFLFKKICIASDHAGFDLKETIKNHLVNKNVSILKKQTKTPVLVGFGIKSRKDALAISNKTKADGIIIGSALIKKYFEENMNSKRYLVALNKFIKQVKI